MTLLQLETGTPYIEDPLRTSVITYRGVFCSFHHGVGNNPLQEKSVSHKGYLAVWCVSEQNKRGFASILGGFQKEIAVTSENTMYWWKGGNVWEPATHRSPVSDY